MKQQLSLVFALTLVCIIATTILGLANQITAAPIKAAAQAKLAENLKSILPNFNNFPADDTCQTKIDGKTYHSMLAKLDGKLTGVAVESFSDLGFGGRVKIVVGFDLNGSVVAVIVTEHKETPGLGTAVTDRVIPKTIFDLFNDNKPTVNLPPSKFLDRFNGLNASTLQGITLNTQGIDAIAGATISSRAVVDAVDKACQVFNNLKLAGEIK
ncbi:MAG: RnfABCDGE type electron transport complex subunit G [Lentisphaeria bacterium]